MDGYDTQAIGYVAPFLASAVHTPVNAFGLIFSAGLAGAAFGAFTFGPLADRFGRRPPLILSCKLPPFLASRLSCNLIQSTVDHPHHYRDWTGRRGSHGLSNGRRICAKKNARTRRHGNVFIFSPRRIYWRDRCVTFDSRIRLHRFPPRGSLPLVIGLVLIVQMPGFYGSSPRAAPEIQLRQIVAKIAPDLHRGDFVSPFGTIKPSQPHQRFVRRGLCVGDHTLVGPSFLGFMVILTVVLSGPSLLNESGIPLSVGALIFAAHYLGGFIGTACWGILSTSWVPRRCQCLAFFQGPPVWHCLAS